MARPPVAMLRGPSDGGRIPHSRPAPRPGGRPLSSARAIALVFGLAGLIAGSGLVSGVPGLSPGPIGVVRGAPLHTNGASPPPSAFSSAAYDAADGYVVLFGGQDVAQNALGTTWIFRGGNWTNLTPQLPVAPSARWGASMAYDPADHEIVLFGGCPNLACVPALSDTWVFHSSRWSDLTGSLNLSPPARGQAMMTYDSVGNGSALLFGGNSGGGGSAWLGDLWAFHAGHWQSIPEAPNATWPAPRGNAAFVYDPALKEDILFGGSANSGLLADTWTYSAGAWHDATGAQSSAPSARKNMQATYDPFDGYLLLEGGYNHGTYLGDVWSFGTSGWATLPTSSSPEARYGAGFAFDGADNVTLLFSGVGSGGDFTGTWTYSGGAWHLLINPPGNESPLLGALVGSFFIVFLGVLLAVVFFVSGRKVRARLNGPFGFTPGPSEPLQWVDAGALASSSRTSRQVLGAVVGVVAIFLVVSVLLIASTDFFAVFALLPIILILPLALRGGNRTNTSQRVQRVGIASAGVIFRRKGAESRIPWNELTIYTYQLPNSGLFRFAYTNPAFPGMPVVAAVSIAQAQAIFGSPYAPRWPLTDQQAAMLGLPPRSGAPFPPPPSSAGPAGAPAPPGYYNPFPPPVTSPGTVAPVMPPPPPGAPGAPAYANPFPAPRSAAPPPPAGAPLRSNYGPPPPPAPPPPSAPRYRRSDPRGYRCTTCGHFLPDAAYTFCPTCGAPV